MPSLFFVFKKSAQTNLENLVSWCAGPMVHVDIVLGDSKIMFTSYMFESFSMNRPQGYTASTHETLCLDVTQEEYDAAQSMLLRLVELKIPYNFADVFHLIVPSSTLVQDVALESDIDTLFCSQAVTLVLRMSLDPKRPLHAALSALNSRCTTPTMLHEGLALFCQPVDCSVII